MSLFTITKAVNASIARSVAISELKHTQKLTELRLKLAEQADLCIDESATRLNKARIVHYTYQAGLNPQQLADYQECKAYLKAAIAPPAPTT